MHGSYPGVQFGGAVVVGIGAAVVVGRGCGAGGCVLLRVGGPGTNVVGRGDGDGGAELVVSDGTPVGSGASVDEVAPLSVVVVSDGEDASESDGTVNVTVAAVGSGCGVFG
jgi:hypothetical protein